MSDALRIGDAEREQAAADLGEHFAQGRLSVDEHAERLEQVWVAKTRAELVPLFRDLPGGAYGARPAGPAPAPPGQGRSDRPWRRRRFPVPVFAIIGLLVLIAVVTHAPFLFFGVLIPLVRQPRPAAATRSGPTPTAEPSSSSIQAKQSLGQLAQRPGRVARAPATRPGRRPSARQVLAQVAQPEVVARRAVLGPDQPDQRRQREAQVEVGGLGDVAAGDRAVDQPLVGRPALPRLRDRGLQRLADVLLLEDDQPVRVVQHDRRAVPAYVEVRVPVRQVRDVQVDDAGRLEQQTGPVLQVHEALPAVRPHVLGDLPDVAHVEARPAPRPASGV